jgi:hypothetical protein
LIPKGVKLILLFLKNGEKLISTEGVPKEGRRAMITTKIVDQLFILGNGPSIDIL